MVFFLMSQKLIKLSHFVSKFSTIFIEYYLKSPKFIFRKSTNCNLSRAMKPDATSSARNAMIQFDFNVQEKCDFFGLFCILIIT